MDESPIFSIHRVWIFGANIRQHPLTTHPARWGRRFI